jgi:hypothetical protein
MHSRKGFAAQFVAFIVVLVVLAGGFGYYFISANASLTSLNSQVSTLQSASASQVQLVAVQQSEISCLNEQVRSLQQEISSTGLSVAVNSTSSTSSAACIASVGASHVTVGGTLTVPSGTGVGTLMVSVYNGANESISNVTVDIQSALLTSPNGPLLLSYNGAPINGTSALPVGATASGSATVESGKTGLYVSYGYSFNVYITFSNGALVETQLYATAQV